jgi:hypothetical protein
MSENKIKIYNKEKLIRKDLGLEKIMPDKWPLIKVGIDEIQVNEDIVTVTYDYIETFIYKISEQKNIKSS